MLCFLSKIFKQLPTIDYFLLFQISIADQRLLLGEEADSLRWFLLPSEAADLMAGVTVAHFPRKPPFTPKVWNKETLCSTITNDDRDLGKLNNGCYFDKDRRNVGMDKLTPAETLNHIEERCELELLGGKTKKEINREVSLSTVAHSCSVSNVGTLSDWKFRRSKEEEGKMPSTEHKVNTSRCNKNMLSQDNFGEEQDTSSNKNCACKEASFQDINSCRVSLSPITSEHLSCSLSTAFDIKNGQQSSSEFCEDDSKITLGGSRVASLRGKNFELQSSKIKESCCCLVKQKTESDWKSASLCGVLDKDVTKSEFAVLNSDTMQAKAQAGHSVALRQQQVDTNQLNLKVVPNKKQVACTSNIYESKQTETAVRSKSRFHSPPKTIFKPAVQV